MIFCFNLMKFRFEYLQRSSKSGAVYFVWFYSREHTFSVISPFWIFRLLFGFGYYLSVHYKVPNQLFNHGFCSYCWSLPSSNSSLRNCVYYHLLKILQKPLFQFIQYVHCGDWGNISRRTMKVSNILLLLGEGEKQKHFINTFCV